MNDAESKEAVPAQTGNTGTQLASTAATTGELITRQEFTAPRPVSETLQGLAQGKSDPIHIALMLSAAVVEETRRSASADRAAVVAKDEELSVLNKNLTELSDKYSRTKQQLDDELASRGPRAILLTIAGLLLTAAIECFINDHVLWGFLALAGAGALFYAAANSGSVGA
jgi:hypothetical protein